MEVESGKPDCPAQTWQFTESDLALNLLLLIYIDKIWISLKKKKKIKD